MVKALRRQLRFAGVVCNVTANTADAQRCAGAVTQLLEQALANDVLQARPARFRPIPSKSLRGLASPVQTDDMRQ